MFTAEYMVHLNHSESLKHLGWCSHRVWRSSLVLYTVVRRLVRRQRGLNTKRPTLVFFWVPRNLSIHMDRRARTGDTVLVKSREITDRPQTLPWWQGGGGVKTTENKIHRPRCCKACPSSILGWRLFQLICPAMRWWRGTSTNGDEWLYCLNYCDWKKVFTKLSENKQKIVSFCRRTKT